MGDRDQAGEGERGGRGKTKAGGGSGEKGLRGDGHPSGWEGGGRRGLTAPMKELRKLRTGTVVLARTGSAVGLARS